MAAQCCWGPAPAAPSRSPHPLHPTMLWSKRGTNSGPDGHAVAAWGQAFPLALPKCVDSWPQVLRFQTHSLSKAWTATPVTGGDISDLILLAGDAGWGRILPLNREKARVFCFRSSCLLLTSLKTEHHSVLPAHTPESKCVLSDVTEHACPWRQ